MNRLTKLSRSIKNSVVLITGAASGMGKATAELFADEGAITIATDINKKDIEKVVAKIKENGKEAESLVLDVGSKDSISECVNKIITKYGQIDILINNAGIAIPTKIDSDEYEIFWDKTHDILLKGQVRLIRECLPFLKKSSFPRIVNISSTEGLGASPNHSPYTSAKHGVIGLTRSLAVELGYLGITVNCICPGPINTSMTEKIPQKDKDIYSKRRVPLRRYGDPEEVAHATLNFCLPSSSYITGSVLQVDGGLTVKRA
jgi:3-oxoacyl-[acyl-carrier protein] reductase|tara:strand:+ start:489 stop:1268 length:780 start_codon:yes stop_codon:yes gene_type:complete